MMDFYLLHIAQTSILQYHLQQETKNKKIEVREDADI